MKLYDNFIGADEVNMVMHWSGGDQETVLAANLKKMPFNWYYRDREITYTFNSLGHRSKEIKEIDLDNYVLVTGCSNTEGVGVELELTYPYLLARKMQCDYYNLAIGGSGIDVLIHNLVVWFSTVKKKPKAVIIQWPDYTRYVTGDAVGLQPRGAWDNDPESINFLMGGLENDFFTARKTLSNSLINALITVPVINFTIGNLIPFDNQSIGEPVVDFARDLAHPGNESHENFAESIHAALSLIH